MLNFTKFTLLVRISNVFFIFEKIWHWLKNGRRNSNKMDKAFVSHCDKTQLLFIWRLKHSLAFRKISIPFFILSLYSRSIETLQTSANVERQNSNPGRASEWFRREVESLQRAAGCANIRRRGINFLIELEAGHPFAIPSVRSNTTVGGGSCPLWRVNAIKRRFREWTSMPTQLSMAVAFLNMYV